MLRRGSYAESGIQWHGTHVGQPDFSENSRLVAYTIGVFCSTLEIGRLLLLHFPSGIPLATCPAVVQQPCKMLLPGRL